MSLTQPFILEIQQEMISTRKMLERVPAASFNWKPHEKSTPLGILASHVANLPGMLTTILTQDELDFAGGNFVPPMPESTAELVERFDRNVERGLKLLQEHSDEQMQKNWRLRQGEHVLFELPRTGVIRSMLINHLIHHRGQLSVYLRLLDVPLPSIYGPTADEQF